MRLFSPNKEKGFTLLEVAFVITIFAIMASIVLFRFKDFGTRTALDNLAQDVALRIVGAQKTAISGTLAPGVTGTDESSRPSYGVYFVSGAAGDTVSHQFTYFTDSAPHDGLFEDLHTCPAALTVGNECISVTTITTGEYVSNICYTTGGSGAFPCVPTGSVHISFTRPFPDATMNICATAGACSPIRADRVYIEVASGIDPTQRKTIIATSLGQVRVFKGTVEAAGSDDGVSLP